MNKHKLVIFYSGGSPIPERSLKQPGIMLSYYTSVVLVNDRPDARLRRILVKRGKARSKGDRQ